MKKKGFDELYYKEFVKLKIISKPILKQNFTKQLIQIKLGLFNLR